MEARDYVVPAERARSYLAALRRLWWLVLVTTVMAASAGFLVSSNQQKRYDAAAKVLVGSPGADPVNVLQHSTIPNPQDPERDVNTNTALVKTDSIARHVRAQLNLPLSSSQVLRDVSASPVGTSNIIAIKVRDTRPARAVAIANAFAREYVQLRRVEAQEPYRTAAAQAQLQLARLGPGDKSKVVALHQQLQQLQIAGALQTGAAQVVDTAVVPTSAATPKPKFAAAVAAFIGFLVGALVAIAIGQRPSPASLRLLRADDDESAESSTNGSAGLSEEEAASHVRAADKAHPVPTEEAESPPVRVSRYTDS
jgi:uncharacterized protein involved in exopolysaccharide biosynthesis